MNKFTEIIHQTRDLEISHLRAMGLTQADAEDIFQEASVVLYDTLSGQRLALKRPPEAYLHGICTNMAHKRLEELRRQLDCIDDDQLDRLLELTEEPAIEDTPTISYQQVLQQILSELMPRDFAIIHGFYIEGKNLEQLAKECHLASVEVARTTKCRIMNRLRERASFLTNQLF